SQGPATFPPGPRIVLPLEGPAVVQAGAGAHDVEQGSAVFVSHADGDLAVTATGSVAVIGPGTMLG
ncbi:MAG: hypothetical protein WDZ57_00095, partial [Demequina sp.]